MVVMCLCHLEESGIMGNCARVVIENNREPDLFPKGIFVTNEIECNKLKILELNGT